MAVYKEEKTNTGRVNRNFFMEKFCYGKTGKEG